MRGAKPSVQFRMSAIGGREMVIRFMRLCLIDVPVPDHASISAKSVSETLFAFNLIYAIARQGADEYCDPPLFFVCTHLTPTLQGLICDVLETLRGGLGANSVIHLNTNFGGGKTHAELALYHLLTSLQVTLVASAVAALLAKIGVKEIPQAAMAALPCADLYSGGQEARG